MVRFPVLLVLLRCWQIMETARLSPRTTHTTTMPLHCPKCGDILTEGPDGQLACVRGRMDFALELAQRLRDCYVTKIREPKDTVFAHRGGPHAIGGGWFCPGCGGAAQELTPPAIYGAQFVQGVLLSSFTP